MRAGLDLLPFTVEPFTVWGKKLLDVPAISKFLLTLDVYALPWTVHLEQLWLGVSSIMLKGGGYPPPALQGSEDESTVQHDHAIPFFWGGAMICSWLGLGNTMQTTDCTKPGYRRHNAMMTSLRMLCVGHAAWTFSGASCLRACITSLLPLAT